MSKQTSMASLISLVAAISLALGFTIGFFSKQPVTEMTEAYLKNGLLTPLQNLVEFNEFNMYNGQPYASFSFLSGALAELEEQPDKNNTNELVARYLELLIPKIEQYCDKLYDLGSAKKDCLKTISTVNSQISRNIPHNQALKRIQ